MTDADSILAWRLLECASEAGSMQGAAATLGLDPATAGRMIGRLEASLGQRLVVKRMRPFTLTEAGRLAVRRMHPVIESYAEVLDLLKRDAGEPAGLVRISAAGGYACEMLIPELMEFISLYPDIDFDVRVSQSLEALKRDLTDIVLVTDRPDDEALVAQWRDHSVFIPIASPDYIAKYGSPRHPRELSAHFGFCYSGPVRAKPAFMERDGERVFFRWRKQISVTSILAVKNAVLRGYGCAVDMPIAHCHKEIREGSLVPILEGWRVPTRDLFCVTTKEKHQVKRIRTFMDWYVPRSAAAGRLRDREISEQIGLQISGALP